MMNVYELVISDKEEVSLDDIVLSTPNKVHVQSLIKEHRHGEALKKYGLTVNNKIMLMGSSCCGKTTTAKAIAHALKKPILVVNLATIVSARIGETSQNIKAIFDKAARDRAVLFLDEFDQIGKARGEDDKDVGEMRRLVNTIIQLIDYYPENSLLIAATNHDEIIDSALMRRFQVRMGFEMPSEAVLDGFYNTLLARFPEKFCDFKRKYEVSFAEAKDFALTKVKEAIIQELEMEEIAISN